MVEERKMKSNELKKKFNQKTINLKKSAHIGMWIEHPNKQTIIKPFVSYERLTWIWNVWVYIIIIKIQKQEKFFRFTFGILKSFGPSLGLFWDPHWVSIQSLSIKLEVYYRFDFSVHFSF